MSNKLKRKVKSPQVMAPISVTNYTLQQISNATGTRVESLKIWLREREKEMREAMEQEYQEKLTDMMDIISMSNVMITLMILHEKWGYTNGLNTFLEAWGDQLREFNRRGAKDIYREYREKYDIQIMFDSDKLNREYGFEMEDQDDGK